MAITAASGAPPRLIQGGMGVAVSGWPLARAVAQHGHLGVVSGTAIDLVFARRLQDGDGGGHLRRALSRFPVPSMAEAALERYLRIHGRAPGQHYRRLPLLSERSGQNRLELCILGAFCEVSLAKEGHGNPIGINLLTKVQIPTLPTLYGAMLAGVDEVLMGAGIPREIPGALDAMSRGGSASLRLDVTGDSAAAATRLDFDPAAFGLAAELSRPRFRAIVSAHTLATVLARKSTGRVDGFIVEAPSAGGHNAPPRGAPRYDDLGQPVYGERDAVDLEVMRDLGLPFWLAGGITCRADVDAALAAGAAGVQVGTLFAFCRESGLDTALRHAALRAITGGEASVRTDARASSTGYPFKVLALAGTAADPAVYAARRRVCDLGYLREAYRRDDGRIGYRCAAEPVDQYVAKGGSEADAAGRVCLCNGLAATVGMGQLQTDGTVEMPLITSGDHIATVARLVERFGTDYSAADVIAELMGAASVPDVAGVGGIGRDLADVARA